ncbi:MAG: response regulator [Firmicutes bacterium]|nr:response regulator [Bacillota bacterium]
MQAAVGRPVEILLVEDNPGDVRLTQEALKDGKVGDKLTVARDGVEAMTFLRGTLGTGAGERSLPGLILLDLNLPRKDGREVLSEIKTDEKLKAIPVVVLTTSESEKDILTSYRLHANCYITKPAELDKFFEVIKAIEGFWLKVAKLPS